MRSNVTANTTGLIGVTFALAGTGRTTNHETAATIVTITARNRRFCFLAKKELAITSTLNIRD